MPYFECTWRVFQVRQTALLRFLDPFVAVAIAFKTDFLRRFDHDLQFFEDRFVFGLAFFDALVYSYFEDAELLGHNGIQDNHGRTTVGRRTNGTEFKFVAGESER